MQVIVRVNLDNDLGLKTIKEIADMIEFHTHGALNEYRSQVPQVIDYELEIEEYYGASNEK